MPRQRYSTASRYWFYVIFAEHQVTGPETCERSMVLFRLYGHTLLCCLEVDETTKRCCFSRAIFSVAHAVTNTCFSLITQRRKMSDEAGDAPPAKSDGPPRRSAKEKTCYNCGEVRLYTFRVPYCILSILSFNANTCLFSLESYTLVWAHCSRLHKSSS